MAGMTVANRCASKGLKVAITDELPYGGTCALRGCDPKRIIIGATEVRDFARRLKGKGIDTIPEVNWADVIAFKQSFVDAMPPKIEKGYKHKGIDTYHTSAKFLSNTVLQVGAERIEADKIVVATGAKPRELDFAGGDLALSSTDFLNLEELPASLLFVGGGYIAFEFAHIAARSGAQVTIVHSGIRPLEHFDEDLVHLLVNATKELGIELVLKTEVSKIERLDDHFVVSGISEGKEVSFESASVFNSAGRPPAIFDLDLEKGGIPFSEKGIAVNEYLQSPAAPNIYAAGDAADSRGLPLTPVAVMEGHVVSSNIIKGNRKKVDYPPMPSVVFTQPTLAAVGLTEAEAKAQDIAYEVNHEQVGDWFNAKRLNTREYAFKTIINKEDQTLLGAHLVGPLVEETINLFALAIKAKMKISDLRTMIFTYPTLSSDVPYMI